MVRKFKNSLVSVLYKHEKLIKFVYSEFYYNNTGILRRKNNPLSSPVFIKKKKLRDIVQWVLIDLIIIITYLGFQLYDFRFKKLYLFVIFFLIFMF